MSSLAARSTSALGIALLLAVAAPRAQAAPEWIFRGLTLPRGEVALDVGLGMGHQPVAGDPSGDRSITGYGLNLEIAFGVTHDLELGLRTGMRFGADGGRTRADGYGRPWDTETYGTGIDRFANPELRLLWMAAQGSIVQVGFDLRVYLPIESGTAAGLMFALPVRLRLGAARIDTGVYIPVLFYGSGSTEVSIPVHLWIQASRTLWLGPLLGVRFVGDASRAEYPFGFGLGVALASAIDFRTWVSFPDINGTEAARRFGAGVALQIRF